MHRAITPSAVPASWRRATHATKPMIASAVTRMSSGAVSGKNMSKNESFAPSGRAPYFMSVMYWWLPTNGPIHHADSRTTATPIQSPWSSRFRGWCRPSTIIRTMTAAPSTV